MIDYLIYDKKRQIWINLESYFESYEFSNFERFFGFFLNLFRIFCIYFLLLNIKNIAFIALTWQLTRKSNDVSQRCDVCTRHVAHSCA